MARLRSLGPALVALGVFILLVRDIDSRCLDSNLSGPGPGLTVDEVLNVSHGVEMADDLLRGDFGAFREQATIVHDYPPLGRVWLGLWHEASLSFFESSDQVPISFPAARVGACVAFALTIFYWGELMRRWHGPGTGALTALCIALSPRLFGHAHIASIESILNLTMSLALGAILSWWISPPSEPKRHRLTWKRILLSGLGFGLVLLTKVQAILVPIPVVFVVLLQKRASGILPLLFWGSVSCLVFLFGWPWLWEDPVGHTLQYIRPTAKRAPILAWYLHHVYVDREVPWHYAWVLFATTMPLLVLIPGLIGACSKGEGSVRRRAIALFALFPLLVFSLPGVPIYDAERLFSTSQILWAVLAGHGLMSIWNWILASRYKLLGKILGLFILGTNLLLTFLIAPFYLSYYTPLIGGLPGAERVGLPVTYWGDTLSGDLIKSVLEQVPKGSTVDCVPVSHGLQLPALMQHHPGLREHQIQLRAFRPDYTDPPVKYVLVVARREYLDGTWENGEPPGELIALEERMGVWLAGLYLYQSPKSSFPLGNGRDQR